MVEEYDFKEEPAPPRKRGTRISPTPETTDPPVLNYRTPAAAKSKALDPDQFKNIQLPIWLLTGGIVVQFVSSLWSRDSGVIEVTVDLLLVVPLMLVGIIVAAKLRGLWFGAWHVSILKLAAIAVAPSAVVRLVEPILFLLPIIGLLIGLVVQFILYFALLGALFDLDESDTWYVVWVLFLVRVVFYFASRAIFHT